MGKETPPVSARFGQSRRRVLYRVPVQLRENKKHIYEPVVLPLGPYHHSPEPQFQAAEQLKNELRDILCGANDKGFLLSKILGRMDDIKHFYGGEDRYLNEELAEMMLRDACFLLCYLEKGEIYDLMYRHTVDWECREKGILYSKLASDEEMVRMFKSIDTYGFSNCDLFYDVIIKLFL